MPRLFLLITLLGFGLPPSTALAQDGVQCLEYARGRKLGRMDSKKIDEASGLVASLAQPGVYWTHNDHGDDDRVFAISDDGDYYGQWNLRGADADDWEDIALGPCDDGEWACLYIADLGNNNGKRDEFVIWRVREPEVDTDKNKPYDEKTDEDAEGFFVSFPFDEAPDAEALFVGNDGAVYVLTKEDEGVGLFELWPLPAGGEHAELVEVGWRDDLTFVTGADIAPDGERFVMRSVQLAWEFQIGPDGDIARAFMSEPLEVRLRGERQGEAIAYSSDGAALITTSEGEEQPVYHYACELFAGDDGKFDTAAPVGAGSPGETSGCQGGPQAVGWCWALMLLLVVRSRRRVRAR